MATKQNEARQTDDMPRGADDGMPGGARDLDGPMAALTGGTAGSMADFLSSLDLTKVPDSGFAVLTHGETYDFNVRRATPGVSGQQNKTLKFILEVAEEYAEAGKQIMDTITFTSAAMWRFKSACMSAGLLSEEGGFLGASEQDFVGTRVRAKVKNEPWDGQMRTKVDGPYLPPDGASGAGAEAGFTPNFG